MLNRNGLLFNRFIKLIEENHEDITGRFMNDLMRNPEVQGYRNLNREQLYEASDLIYREISRWIDKGFSKEKIAERYLKLGRERFSEGIPFSQTQKALVLQKRHLWLFVMEKLDQDHIAYMEALELNNRVTLYFDRAIYYMLRGYENMIFRGV
jgi:hypothetical protein